MPKFLIRIRFLWVGIILLGIFCLILFEFSYADSAKELRETRRERCQDTNDNTSTRDPHQQYRQERLEDSYNYQRDGREYRRDYFKSEDDSDLDGKEVGYIQRRQYREGTSSNKLNYTDDLFEKEEVIRESDDVDDDDDDQEELFQNLYD